MWGALNVNLCNIGTLIWFNLQLRHTKSTLLIYILFSVFSSKSHFFFIPQFFQLLTLKTCVFSLFNIKKLFFRRHSLLLLNQSHLIINDILYLLWLSYLITDTDAIFHVFLFLLSEQRVWIRVLWGKLWFGWFAVSLVWCAHQLLLVHLEFLEVADSHWKWWEAMFDLVELLSKCIERWRRIHLWSCKLEIGAPTWCGLV